MRNIDILIKNGTIVTMNSNRDIWFRDIRISNGKIAEIKKNIKPNTICKVIDAKGKIVIPGFIQTHVHLCQTLFRNRADGLSLLDWLKKRIWPLEASHNPDSIRVSAQLGIGELLLSGTTTIMDMGTLKHTDIIFETVLETGIRYFGGKAMMDHPSLKGDSPLFESTKNSIKQSMILYEKYHGQDDNRVNYAFAPRFVLSCTDSLLKEINGLAKKNNLLIHSHVSENKEEIAQVKKQTGKDNLKYMNDLGLTGSNLCLAHGVWLTKTETDIMAKSGSKLIHCPSSNLKLGSGFAPIPEYINKNILVSLGADGAPCNNNLNMFTEMRLAALIHKPKFGPLAMEAEKVFEMATINGAKTLGIEKVTGSIELNKDADIAILNPYYLKCTPEQNIYSSIVYSMSSQNVDYVVVKGLIVVEKSKLKVMDTYKVRENSIKEIKKVEKRALKIGFAA